MEDELPKFNYGLVRPVPEELANQAHEAIVLLVAALAAPMPMERWDKVPLDELDEVSINKWGDKWSDGEGFDSACFPLAPWRQLARRVQYDPAVECYRIVRTCLTILSAAETLASPFVEIGALITVTPTLTALDDFLAFHNVLNTGVPVKGSYSDNFKVALGKAKRIFRAVFQSAPELF